MNKSIIFKGLPFLLGMVLLFIHQTANAQYTLPKAAVLVENNVQAVHVYKVPIRMVNGRGRDISGFKFDRTPQKMKTYFVNANGRIDSLYYYTPDTLTYQKDIFGYTLDNRLTEITRINHKGEIAERKRVSQMPNKEWHYKTWRHGQLLFEVKCTADSILYESNHYRTESPITYYSTTVFDLEKDIKTETYYEENEIITQKTYQWISDNGIPSGFIYSEYRRAEAHEKGKTDCQQFEVAEDGSVINERNGLFTDPFHSYNYYEREIPFKGMSNPNSPIFRGEKLIHKRADFQMILFDGTKEEFEYRFYYE